MSRRKSNVVSVLAWLLLFGGLIGLIAFLYVYTDHFNEDFKSFYLVHNGEKILTEKSELSFESYSTERIDVVYLFDAGQQTRDYTVEFAPNEEHDFDFTVDGELHRWKGEDLSQVFDRHLTKASGYFELEIPAGFNIREALRYLYPSAKAVETEEELDDSLPYFSLRVTSYNGSVTYRIDFSVAETSKPSYTITVEVAEEMGEYVSVTCPEEAYVGQEIRFQILPNTGYTVKSVKLRYGENETDVSKLGSSVYSNDYGFVMPNSDVTLAIELNAPPWAQSEDGGV